MKHLRLSLFVTLVTIFSCLDASAQVFSQMAEKQRNAELIKIAKKFYRHPKFKFAYKQWGMMGTPTITSFKGNMVPYYAPNKAQVEEEMGQLTYMVNIYAKSDHPEWKTKAARVYISDKAGIAYYIVFADNTCLSIWSKSFRE